MSEEITYLKIKAIMNQYEGVNLHDTKKGNGTFRFPVYIKEKYKDIGIEALNLSVRAENCLKRARINTVYDLMTKISGRSDLDKIRSCGLNTSRSIMEELFVFQYESLSKEQREKYIEKVIALNR